MRNTDVIIRKNWVLHVVVCCVVLIQPYLFPSRPLLSVSFFHESLWKDYAANVLLIVFFYANYYYLIPKFYLSKKLWVYAGAIIFSLLLILLLPNFVPEHGGIGPLALPPPNDFMGHDKIPSDESISYMRQWQNYFTGIDHQFFMFFSSIFFGIVLRENERFYMMQRLRQEAELQYLLAQTNPHFLYNALNGIYALALREKAEGTSAGILQLSNLMRSQTVHSLRDKVLVQEEILLINDFIDLQRVRLSANVKLTTEINVNVRENHMAPMMLMPFIENAFKHGVNPDKVSEIYISIDVHDDKLFMIVKNKKVVKNNARHKDSGIGLKNVIQRLLLIYPKRHELEINDADGNYIVTLIISL